MLRPTYSNNQPCGEQGRDRKRDGKIDPSGFGRRHEAERTSACLPCCATRLSAAASERSPGRAATKRELGPLPFDSRFRFVNYSVWPAMAASFVKGPIVLLQFRSESVLGLLRSCPPPRDLPRQLRHTLSVTSEL